MATAQDLATIKKWMYYADEIAEESARTGCPLAEGCTMLEKETTNARNVFGCDHGDVGDVPPYCNQPVTASRVTALRAHPQSNGVGPAQLTYDPFVDRADKYGGAHIPRFNIRVGFEILKDYLDRYPLVEAFGAYNRGEAQRSDSIGQAYGADALAKLEWWRANLGGDASATPAYPEIDFADDAEGWLVEVGGKRWARVSTKPNALVRSNKNGWLWVPVSDDDDAFVFPIAETPPNPNSYWYAERCPTRYSWREGGREDVRAWAVWLIENYPVWCNTYHNHPESVYIESGVSREFDSLDVWGPQGRGDPLDQATGDNIFAVLMNDPNPPNIEWIIWRGVIYGAWNGWAGEPFGTDPFSWHHDHVHCTFKE